MIRIELSTLITKLNPITKLAMEEAASLCIGRRNEEITLSHLLYSLLENPLCDVKVLLKHSECDVNEFKTILGNSLPTGDTLDTYPAFSPLLVELLQDAWLLSTTELQETELRSGTIFLAALMQSSRYLPFELVNFFSDINREAWRKNFTALTSASAESTATESSGTRQPLTDTANSALDKFTTNFTQFAKDNELDPVLCRDDEINLMIDILCRRRKNNPIVVGDAGVGKSAVVEGLALRIVADKVPDSLKGVQLLSLDLGLLQAGASVKGEFEKRLKGVIDEVKHSAIPIILFIDEAHTLIGAGNQEGGGDAANLLKPALARGELRTIGATTWKEYKKYFEKDPALTRRFQLVKLDEPTAEQAVTILRGLHGVYESEHKVLIQDCALKAAAHLSNRYLSGRQLPDKAIDVLDTACARIAINLTSPPRYLAELEGIIHQTEVEMSLLLRQASLGQVVDEEHLTKLRERTADAMSEHETLEFTWRQQQDLVNKIIELRGVILADDAESDLEALRIELNIIESQLELLSVENRLVIPQVDEHQIASVIADWTGVPVDQMNSDELHKITNLPQLLGESLKGQDIAISRLHKNMLTARADLRKAGRPKGAFLLVGPSGVGKTETVIQIAEQLYGGKQFLTTINMSEYQEKHTVSRLIGSPPGYVGYGEGGVLTESIRKMPYSIVLLDEVEKAHPDVLNLFYQAFDKGELADGEGRLIDCQNILFFLTSNLGYQTIVDNAETPELIENSLYPELSEFFKPALLARMEIVPFLPLGESVLREIIASKLAALIQRLELRYKAEVTCEQALTDEIIKRTTRTENGARMLEAIIDGQMLPPIALALLNKLADKEPVLSIRLGCVDGEFVGEVS
ncbi:ClpV1 family T6SS ATPase [Shewanella hanedai]|uniref:Type VI secretion system ATPase TssH n=1 Tax=Shewanella hanedai TaxID=25 RepID=A0A553JLI8_SHEHA|nr:type VI secretion system ATPase TssH [Shewanella hanedai]TRY13325.1 type VI secretion system ATPase TssH [Shewanella hanedai]GGJ00739.1 ClpV1 family T6SS ATPase [Shewanella hanedai]